MAIESEHNENPPQMSLSRRDFLRQGTLGSAALAPGIVLLSSVRPRASASSRSDIEKSRAAEYELNVGTREAAPDGRSRSISCYNGRLPGPLIRAKLGQKLRIQVNNHLSTPTSVHWHGMHQPGTWQMDGVDEVSRKPIPPGSTFVYEFTATPAGTHWYHSHVGVQYGNGLIGPLVVDEVTPPATYDREEILLINDWFLRPAEEILAGLVHPHRAAARMPAMTMKRGSSQKSGTSRMPANQGMPMKSMGGKPDIGDVPFESALFNGVGRFAGTRAPLTTLRVRAGETLRLRLINASSTYAFRFQIDGHPLTVIASDGSPVVPVKVDNLVFSPGERYDVLLGANQSGAAWIRAATLAGNEARAILRYADAPNEEPAASPVVWGKRSLARDGLRSPKRPTLEPNPRQVLLRLGGAMQPYAWSINGQDYPHAQPITVAQDEWLRFVLDNPTGMDHPFHLHGHYFFVLGTPDHLNLLDPPRKDTVNVPAGRQLALLWKANNPGRWFFHCHIEWHVATGMARVVEITRP
jgi:FtsP/CotA-like multicopper oxidase with cupredoxin domain